MRVQRRKERGVAGSVRKEARTANKHENTRPCFPFCENKSPQSIVSSIIQCQNIYLPITDKDGIEGKFAMGVIFRYVLICRIYLQLAFTPLIPREEWESNSII